MRVIVRIQAREKKLREDGRPNRGLAALGSAITAPMALVSFFLCAWRWAVDLEWFPGFLVAEGMLSHWQMWFVSGTVWQALAVMLRRYAESGEADGSEAVASAEFLRKELP